MSKNEKKIVNQKPQLDAARLAEVIYRTNYISRKELQVQNFLRGMAFGAGSVLGATVIIAILLWVLSFFDTVPFLGPIIDSTRESIEQR